MALIQLMRPHQWIKNLFVLVGILFGHAWFDAALLRAAGLAFLAFCAVSSAVYIYNDVVDRAHDATHPRKRLRPLPSGRVSVTAALVLSAVLVVAAVCLAAAASTGVVWVVLTYLVLNLAYSHYLKHVVVLDVFCIAAGFILRIIAGTVAIGIPASSWLLICSAMLTLFLGFAKRRAEIAVVPQIAELSTKTESRPVLQQYTQLLLDSLLIVTGTCSVITYGLYTMSPVTIQLHGTANLIFTLPFVLYGLFRYLYMLQAAIATEDVSRDFFKDPHIWVTVTLWFATTFWLIGAAGG
jgi:4-hydroxybenzoate polyprenyltransferase